MNLLRLLAFLALVVWFPRGAEAQELLPPMSPTLSLSSLETSVFAADESLQLPIIPRFTDEELTRRRRRRASIGTFFCTAIGAPLSLFLLTRELEDEVGNPVAFTTDLVALSLFVQTLISFGGTFAGFRIARRNGGGGPYWAGFLGWLAGTATAALIATIAGAASGEHRKAGLAGIPLLAILQTTGILMGLEWAHRKRRDAREESVSVNVGIGSLRIAW